MATGIRAELEMKLNGATEDEFIQALFAFMEERGQSHYDEAVTQIEHALQCADLATQDGCSDEAVTAALFHDIGHLLLDEHDAQVQFLAEDLNHEGAGASLLAPYFPESVTEPIRLHVPAKRYLCTVDPEYHSTLSDASKRSFEVQGGMLSEEERAELESNPALDIAVRLRRFDDLGKDTDGSPPSIDAYADCVKRCLRPVRP